MIRAVLAVICVTVCSAAVLSSPAMAPAAEAPDRPTQVVPSQPRTSLAEIEDEVMCPVCGTLLGLSDAPQAERQRVLIRRLIDEGRTKQEIKDELVEEFGPAVLALPEGSGFNLAAYLVPIGGFLAAAILLLLAVRRWRRETDSEDDSGRGPGGPSPGRQSNGIDPEEERRLDADLARYDL